MKKFLPYLERYVQWIALGLGALFVLYMVYAYVITPPVSATVAGKTVDLGNVDKVTREGAADPLNQAIQRGPANGVGGITVPEMLPKFAAGIAGEKPAPLAADYWNAPTKLPYVPGQPNTPPTGIANLGNPADAPPQVAVLTPPAAIYVALSTGRSSVTPPPDPVAPPAAAADPANPAPPPSVQAAAAQPAQPIQGAAAVAGGANAQPTIDKNWVSIHYRIPSGALADAFKAAKIPPVRSATTFLRVELTRQEKLADDKWGNDTVVPPLALAFFDAPPWPNGPAPDPVAEQAYNTWAQAHAQAILQPVFYQVIKGDQPGLPGDPLQHVGILAPVAKAFDPAKPGLPSTWTPEQKTAVEAYRAQQRLNRPRTTPRPTPGARPPTRGGRGGAGGAGGGEAAFAPQDAQRPTLLYQVRPPVRRPTAGVTAEDMATMDGADGGIGGPGVVQQLNNEALNKLALTIPNPNNFDPAQLTVDVDVIAYDETPTPGKTYRYQMRYYILNPILGAVNLVKNPAQAQKFALPSAPTDWSLPVEVQPTISFFLAGGSIGGADSVKVDLYRWQNGDVNKATQTVAAGDHVGLTTKDGIDYNTNWTVVDVRRSGNGEGYALFQDTDGMMARREFKGDPNSPLKKDLDTQAAAAADAAKAAAAANPTTPGATPILTH